MSTAFVFAVAPGVKAISADRVPATSVDDVVLNITATPASTRLLRPLGGVLPLFPLRRGREVFLDRHRVASKTLRALPADFCL